MAPAPSTIRVSCLPFRPHQATLRVTRHGQAGWRMPDADRFRPRRDRRREQTRHDQVPQFDRRSLRSGRVLVTEESFRGGPGGRQWTDRSRSIDVRPGRSYRARGQDSVTSRHSRREGTMHYTRISADCHIDMPWIPRICSRRMRRRCSRSACRTWSDGPDGPHWTCKNGTSFGVGRRRRPPAAPSWCPARNQCVLTMMACGRALRGRQEGASRPADRSGTSA